MKTAPRAQDVADLAQVSQSAVSRTFTPGASVSEEMRRKVLAAAQRLGYPLVKWSFDTKDFEHNTAETVQLAKDIFDEGVPAAGGLGYVPLVHDIQYQTANNLTEFMLRNLEDKGYAAVTLGDCLGDAPENWYIDAGAGDGNDVGYADCVPDTS